MDAVLNVIGWFLTRLLDEGGGGVPENGTFLPPTGYILYVVSCRVTDARAEIALNLSMFKVEVY